MSQRTHTRFNRIVREYNKKKKFTLLIIIRFDNFAFVRVSYTSQSVAILPRIPVCAPEGCEVLGEGEKRIVSRTTRLLREGKKSAGFVLFRVTDNLFSHAENRCDTIETTTIILIRVLLSLRRAFNVSRRVYFQLKINPRRRFCFCFLRFTNVVKFIEFSYTSSSSSSPGTKYRRRSFYYFCFRERKKNVSTRPILCFPAVVYRENVCEYRVFNRVVNRISSRDRAVS